MNIFLLEKYFEINYRNKKALPPIIPKIEELKTSEIEIQNMQNKREKLERLINENNNDDVFFCERKPTSCSMIPFLSI